ncbi:MAG: lipoyl(octanoyl) transferase LipB [Bosea sp. (in: a-proteobacteria)]
MPAEIPELPIPLWLTLPGLADYARTVADMEEHVRRMLAGEAGEEIWLVEHLSVITAGTSAVEGDLLDASRFPVVPTGRGGRHTYHGPGQRVVYPMLNLAQRGRDVRRYVAALELWGIRALSDFGLSAFTSTLGTGIWVDTATGPAKIGAIGVRVRRWTSFHGLSINVGTELEDFTAIVPCGIPTHGTTRLSDAVPGSELEDLDRSLLRHLPEMLGFLSALR